MPRTPLWIYASTDTIHIDNPDTGQPGERVYYPRGDGQMIVTIVATNESIVGSDGDALFVPAGVEHQFQNPEAHPVEAVFVAATPTGVTFYDGPPARRAGRSGRRCR
jgi:oxalate decarboxylase/phosphoglucose isomerase-like protein (cupin superfamily)